jgi:hypothetical protein
MLDAGAGKAITLYVFADSHRSLSFAQKARKKRVQALYQGILRVKISLGS